MKPFAGPVLLALATLGSGGHDAASRPHPGPTAAHDVHDAHTGHVDALNPPEGHRWPTDEPLRSAMLRIRTAAEQVAPEYERRQLDAKEALALAATVEDAVAYMVANCKLEPEADAALHVLIGRLMRAATSLEDDPSSAVGVPQVLAVLHDYQSTFDRPGSQPLAAVPARPGSLPAADVAR